MSGLEKLTRLCETCRFQLYTSKDAPSCNVRCVIDNTAGSCALRLQPEVLSLPSPVDWSKTYPILYISDVFVGTANSFWRDLVSVDSSSAFSLRWSLESIHDTILHLVAASRDERTKFLIALKETLQEQNRAVSPAIPDRKKVANTTMQSDDTVCKALVVATSLLECARELASAESAEKDEFKRLVVPIVMTALRTVG